MMQKNLEIFKYSLVVSYYKDNFRGSSFTELAQIMGLTLKVLDKIIYDCIEKNYLEYDVNNLLNITEQGVLFLNEQDVDDFSFQDTEISSLLFDKEPMAIDDIYIPKEFTLKKNC